MDLKAKIREVPDFPKKGILFYDITTMLKDGPAFREVIDRLAEPYLAQRVEKVVSIESRGFIVGAPLADRLRAGFVPVRKPGKLPGEVFEVNYQLEYGASTLAIHRDAVGKGERVLIVDDLLATGGTALAAVQLVKKLGGTIIGLAFVIELTFLDGRARLDGYPLHCLLTY